MAASSLALGALAVSGQAEVWMVYVLAFLFGIGAAFDGPARQSFTSEMVDRDDLTNAVGLNGAAFNLARLLGPASAGLLIALLGSGARAAGWVILLNGLSYFAVIWQLRRMDESLLHPAAIQPRSPGMLLDGVRYVRTQPTMLMVLVLVFFAGTFGMNFQITSALMATQVFDKGAGEFGVLGSAVAVGSLTGALLAARRPRIRLRLLLFAATGFGVAEIVAGLLPSYLTFALFAPVIGFFVITLLNSANATMQLAADPVYRGRVMALYMTVVMVLGPGQVL
jgi:MFS family permease